MMVDDRMARDVAFEAQKPYLMLYDNRHTNEYSMP